MSQYSADQLKEILRLHGMWRIGAEGGARANLSEANLSGANLSRANLSRANLYGADLYGADLSGANLSRANLSGANLSGADLSGANLYGADLSRANLSVADLSGADLSGADHILRGPCLDGYEVFLVRWSDGPRFKAGCRWFTIKEAQYHWRNGGGRWEHDADSPRHCRLMLTGLACLLEIAHELRWEGCEP